MKSNTIIPESLSRLFQEYEFSKMDIQIHAIPIIERTLEFGTWDELHWLFSTYGINRIQEYLRQFGQKRLSKITLNYWCKLLRVKNVKSTPWAEIKEDLWKH